MENRRQNVFLEFCILTVLLQDSFGRTVHSEDYGLGGKKYNCVPLGESFCKNVPYNTTVFPNKFGHEDLESARSEFNDFIPLIKTGCSELLEQFLCFAYAPPCTVLETPISACRSYCQEAVTQQCRNILKQFNSTIQPPALECNHYPLSETSVCIQPNNTISQTGSKIGTGSGGDAVDFPNLNYDEDFDDSRESSQEVIIDLDLDLLVTNGNKIQLLNIMSAKNMDTITLYRIQPEFMSTTIDYFYQTKSFIYWASNMEEKIFRGTVDLDTLVDIRPIIDTGSASVESIVVDWNLRVLFWTESVPTPRLRTSSLSGRRVTTLLSQDMKHPISLTIDPTAGKLFWIERQGGDPFDQTPSIQCYSIVTEKLTTIFNISALTVVNGGRPKALVADYIEKRLYYVDVRSQSLHSLKYDGSDHKVVLSDHPFLREPDSLAVYNEYVIWTDKMTNSLIWVDKNTGENELVIKTFDTGPPQNIKVYGAKDNQKSTPSYQKTSLAEKWLDISSAENMKDVDIKDDYNYDDDDDDDDDVTDKKDGDRRGCSVKNAYHSLLLILTILLCRYHIAL